jgi:sporulation protein YlmC with PRC-barrel domain
MTNTLRLLAISLIALFMAQEGLSQDEGFIYGTVTTVDNKTYKGALRWGKEETYWSDMFNASKIENDNLDYLTREERDYLSQIKHDNWSSRHVNISWNDWDYEDDHLHQFVTPFGNIKMMEMISREGVVLTLQNGNEVEVNGDGYNDIGTKVKVHDNELGVIEIPWSRIDRIAFEKTPKKLDDKFGSPLYGTVKSDVGKFTGFIQWDHDERVGEDKLDGDTDDGDVSISFDKIASIERLGYSRSVVTLKSGRELELRGSNDVNSENRGIIVTVPGMGRIDIPWKSFDRVTFENAPNSGADYDSYRKQEKLTGKVTVINGDVHEGDIIYDLDEAYSFEVLNGEVDEVEYEIDFGQIKQIKPKNYNYAMVTLQNGNELLLGDSQDVTDRNDGILVMKSGEPVYIPWEKVEQIDFK